MKSAPEQHTAKRPTLLAAGLFSLVGMFGLGLLIGVSSVQAPKVQVSSSVIDETYLEQIFDIINQDYLGEIPDKQTLTYGVAKGLIEALGDQYSGFLDPKDAKDYLQSNDSAYEGIGVQLGFDGQYPTVDTPMDDLPGAKAGLLAGDVILEVDGADMSGTRPEIAATKIRGQAGTEVTLKIYRAKGDSVKEYKIMRQAIDLDNITYEDLGNGYYVIDIAKFTEGAKGLLSGVQVFENNWDKIAQEVIQKSPKGIVLDLRSNPGGYVEAVKYVAEEFLKSGQTILREKSKQGGEKTYQDERQGVFESVPVVVLVDAGSASASEILAAALQENSRAKVAGTSTVGKGVEQKVFTLDDGSMLLLVFRHWLTPKGNQITKEHSITPDVKIEANQDTKADEQLDKALELLLGK